MSKQNLLGTSTINLRTLLANGKRYEVPPYQRDYSWKQEYNVDCDWENTPATIEHVLPENPTTEWLEDFPNDLHERYVSRLGNYLLLESKLNPKDAANKSLPEKLPVYHQSQYPTTNRFSAADWTPQTIDGRQAHMAKLATAIWRI